GQRWRAAAHTPAAAPPRGPDAVRPGGVVMTAATAPATVRPRSPAMVFAACWLLAGVAAARATASIAVFYALPQVNRHYADAHGDAAAGTTASVLFVLLALCSLVVAFLYLLLAILAGKGM